MSVPGRAPRDGGDTRGQGGTEGHRSGAAAVCQRCRQRAKGEEEEGAARIAKAGGEPEASEPVGLRLPSPPPRTGTGTERDPPNSRGHRAAPLLNPPSLPADPAGLGGTERPPRLSLFPV